jgi:hypothetical protein
MLGKKYGVIDFYGVAGFSTPVSNYEGVYFSCFGLYTVQPLAEEYCRYSAWRFLLFWSRVLIRLEIKLLINRMAIL